MKNGFILALLMVAMVALVIPAGAKAPVINQLPAVVVGDAGDISGTGTSAKHLLRYLNVFNLADPARITRFNNPTDATKLKVFYTTADATLKVSNATAIVQPMTAGEVTALTTNGTAPAKQINTATDFWLSLIEVAGVAPANAVAATPAANGSTETELAPVVGKKSVTLYAADVDAVTSSGDVSAPRSFDVYSLLGEADGFSFGVTPVADFDFEGGADGWTFALGGGTFANPTQSTNGNTGIGFQGVGTLSAGQIAHANWTSPANSIPAANKAGKVYSISATMSGNAATQAVTPGYRIIYLSKGVSHVGGVQISSPAAIPQDNTPFLNNTREFKLYFAVPTDMAGYADGGIMTTLQAGTDLRDYYLQFGLIQEEASDNSTIIMDSIVIGTIDRPADVTPAVTWGSGGTAFNDATNGWIENAFNAAVGLQEANAAVSGTGIAFTMTNNNSGYIQTNPNFFGTVFPTWSSSKLVRTSYRVATGNAQQAPDMRFLMIPFTTAGAVLPVVWGDVILTDTMKSLGTPAQLTVLPGAPKTSGSTFETYQFAQLATTGGNAGTLHPIVDMAQQTAGTANGWAKPAAAYTVSLVKMETVQ